LHSERLPEEQAFATTCTTPALVIAYRNAVSLEPVHKDGFMKQKAKTTGEVFHLNRERSLLRACTKTVLQKCKDDPRSFLFKQRSPPPKSLHADDINIIARGKTTRGFFHLNRERHLLRACIKTILVLQMQRRPERFFI
jgi:hypothetical protein